MRCRLDSDLERYWLHESWSPVLGNVQGNIKETSNTSILKQPWSHQRVTIGSTHCKAEKIKWAAMWKSLVVRHTHTHTILPGSVKQEKLQSILPLWNSICKKPGSWNATLPSWLLRGLSLIGLCWENGRGRTAKKQPQSGRFFLLPGELMPMFQSSHSQGLGRHTLRNPAVTACRSSLLGHVCQAKAHWRMKCEDTTHNQKKCTMCKSEERENWALVLSWVRKEQLIIQRKCEWTSGRAAIFDKINL